MTKDEIEKIRIEAASKLMDMMEVPDFVRPTGYTTSHTCPPLHSLEHDPYTDSRAVERWYGFSLEDIKSLESKVEELESKLTKAKETEEKLVESLKKMDVFRLDKLLKVRFSPDKLKAYVVLKTSTRLILHLDSNAVYNIEEVFKSPEWLDD